jgi:hypothetical protein
MNLQNYWPTKENIFDCIKTEAEELSDHTLLSVHEPMHLKKYDEKGTKDNATENDLLQHFLKIERPIPIVASAGMGKSHLIRWLHTKLKVNKTVIDEKWQIVRLPKNASLRQTLNLLLENLEGDVFDQARDRIDQVGSALKESEVADLFVTFISHRIQDIADESLISLREDRGNTALRDKISISNSLPKLITDPHFKIQLLNKESPVYSIATRWIKGASDQEINNTEYEVTLENFESMLDEIEADDLSLPARNCINELRLSKEADDKDQRLKATMVLNEAIGKATQTAFQQLFQFNNGNFQDLFKEIRKHLKKLGRTLVVLVEDLAAISAIEDVLIDCLLEERQEELCVLRSVLAVTTGYHGYMRRQVTIRSRALFEWHIEQDSDNQDNIPRRIVDFCSRYINAARFGKYLLETKINLNNQEDITPIWECDLSESESEQLNAFGASSIGIPLFPYNKQAIQTLSQWYCIGQDGNVVFNPRDILNGVLLNLLRDYRGDFLDQSFPQNVSIKGNPNPTLSSEIAQLGLPSPRKAIVLSSIWSEGFDLKAVQKSLNRNVAEAFSMKDFAKILSSDIEISIADRPERPNPESDASNLNLIGKEDVYQKEIQHWFNGDAPISIEFAKRIRTQLLEMVENFQPSSWSGFENSAIFTDKSNKNVYECIFRRGNVYLIDLPYAENNPPGCVHYFCTESDFKDDKKSMFFQRAALAILRYHSYNKKEETKDWNYPEGYDDFIYYTKFAEFWVPNLRQVMLKNIRKNYLVESLAKQILLMKGLGLKNGKSLQNILLKKSIHIIDTLKPAINEKYQEFRSELISQWDNTQALWLSLIQINNVAFDDDIFNAAYKEAKKVEKELLTRTQKQLKNAAVLELKPSIILIQELLSDCANKDEFFELLEQVKSIYKSISDIGIYPNGFISRPTLSKDIKAVVDDCNWADVQNTIKLLSTKDELIQLDILSSLDGNLIRNISKVLNNWQQFRTHVLPNIMRINDTTSTNQVDKINKEINSSLESIEMTLNEFGECISESLL